MNDVEKKYMAILSNAFDYTFCDDCDFWRLCYEYRKEQGVENTLCDVVSKANDMVQGRE